MKKLVIPTVTVAAAEGTIMRKKAHVTEPG